MGTRTAVLVCLLTLSALAAGCGDNRPYDPDALPCEPVDDGNDCTNDICDENGQPTSVDRGAGETCSGGVCDGDGACVECIEDEDCGDGESCTEADNTCNPITCTDGKQNGDETDVDCGGSCAPTRRCGDTLGCNVANDCQSGVCSGTGGTCTAPRCGDGVEQGSEVCDDGNDTNGDGCDDGTGDACRPTGCGNGVVTAPEVCDDGNSMNGDGCDNNCTATACGNGVRAGTEACDDGDTMAGDGCSGTCTTEPGFTCDTATPNVCIGTCGDGIVVTGEACDDAPPAENGDGCSMTCTLEPGYNCTGSPSTCTTVCGDGVRVGTEGCDDGDTMAGDGCNSSCFVEPGWICAGTPSSCFPICGDGIVRPGEGCDDGDLMPGDGCRANCTVESGYACTGSPSLCAPVCGDGMRIAPEVCDDGNLANGDGCNNMCARENGWTCNMGSPTTCTSTCGDGIPVGTEACDDGDLMGSDGCNGTCGVEVGWTCTGTPSSCTPICGDGRVVPTEPCDDGNLNNTDGCSSTCTVELGYNCQGSPSVCALTCGDGDIDAGETCDDGGTVSLDGCSSSCNLETGWTCMGTPSVCTSVCGDGVIAVGAEQCDDAPPAENGDGCSATCTIDTGYTCTGTPSVCNTTCGDGITAGTETCDDGCGPNTPGVCDPMDNNDGCSSTCVNECGDGVLNPALEQCDDGGRIGGDGCSSTCTFEVTCGAGETLVQINSTDVPKAIPDSPAPNGVDSNAVVPALHAGAIRSVRVGLGRLTHTFVGDLTLSLLSPGGRRRNLSVNRGGGGDNFVTTRFDDAAATSISTIVAGGAPFSAAFRPEQTLSDTAGFRNFSPAGTWQLRAVDGAGGDTGSIVGWTLSICYDPAAAYCGNGATDPGEECDDGNLSDADACNNLCGLTNGCGDGNIDAGEACDDDNVVSGDGCSAACAVDIGCGAGETPVVVSNLTSFPIPDNVAAGGALSPVTVTAVGAVIRVVPHIASITHPNVTDLDIYLVGPNGVTREMSTDNGGTGDNYQQTYLDDAATTTVTSGTAPFYGRFRPELSLSTTAPTDFRAINAAGVWNLRVADDLSANTGTLDGWTLTLCVNPSAPYCGDGITNGVDECDDGNLNDADGCSNRCQLSDGCGDGNLDAGEECDDDNVTPGDGCSSTCVFGDIACGAGETPVVVRNLVSVPVPDDTGSADGSIISTINVPSAGLVRRVITMVNATSTDLADFDMFLTSPYGTQRTLAEDRTGTAYSATLFSDSGAAAITTGTNPYTGTWRSSMTLSDAAGFGNQTAQGNWGLRISDDLTTDTGTLNNWALALCIDPAATTVCGNGFVEPGETCDDGNAVAGDGCGACQIELACGAGQVPVLVSNLNNHLVVNDNQATAGAASVINVAQAGTVRRAVMVVASLSHHFMADIDIVLTSPGGTALDISSDNGSGADNQASTMYDDTAATAITAAGTVGPFRGRFRPEAPLSGVNGQGAAGNWTLTVADDAGIDAGSFSGWTLGLCVE